jgi:L,D-transpeptidase ErfK/SrfK
MTGPVPDPEKPARPVSTGDAHRNAGAAGPPGSNPKAPAPSAARPKPEAPVAATGAPPGVPSAPSAPPAPPSVPPSRPARPPLRSSAHPGRRRLLIGGSGAGALLLLLFLAGSGFENESIESHLGESTSLDSVATVAAKRRASPEAQIRRLDARLQKFMPHGRFIVVDRTHNRLYLRDGDQVLLDAKCSSGSGMLLKFGEQQWIFDTPRGHFRVLSKHDDPVWKKPDWAFIEEGKPVPEDPGERMEENVLGEHALYLGDGYMIHGTLYERLLGYSVTHGCIRLGRQDLQKLYESVPEGTHVYIY